MELYIRSPPPSACEFRPAVYIYCMNTGEDPQLHTSLPSACGQLHINSRSAFFVALNYIANFTRLEHTCFFYESACTFVLANLLTLETNQTNKSTFCDLLFL
jgi:hypothetical protein